MGKPAATRLADEPGWLKAPTGTFTCACGDFGDLDLKGTIASGHVGG